MTSTFTDGHLWWQKSTSENLW